MILSLEDVRGGLQLIEVETEEDAFAEMRRYLEINNIKSTYTEIQWQEADERFDFMAKHKRVSMCIRPSGGVTFGIYHNGKPKHEHLGDEEKWGIKRDILPCYNTSYHYNSSTNKYVCWYDEVMSYLQDLSTRRGCDKQCHS